MAAPTLVGLQNAIDRIEANIEKMKDRVSKLEKGRPMAVSPMPWTGQGVTNGVLDTVECDEASTPILNWVFTYGGNFSPTDVTLNVNGGKYTVAVEETGHSTHFTTPFFDLATLVAYVSWVGQIGNAQLVVSSGCTGPAV
jgi:hypothetical protein